MTHDITIQYFRKKANLKQEELADRLKLPRTTVSFYETKRMYPDRNTAERIAEILGVPVGKLYSEEELNLITFRDK